MKNKIINIAHRGASGYLPEHSLASKALAFGLGADYIEQDLVMTKDDELIVFHDLYLNFLTNIMDIYPNRSRSDGKYYVIDFTFDELQNLKLSERFNIYDNQKTAKFPDRFPIFYSNFKIHKFSDEIELILGLNKSMNKNIGIYPEIKYPKFHRNEGKDISKKTLEILKKYGFNSKNDKIYLQSFDNNELRRIKNDLFFEFDLDLKLIQLIGENQWEHNLINKDNKIYKFQENYNQILSKDGLKDISKYCHGLGINFSMIIDKKSIKDKIIYTDIVKNIKEYDLDCHIYTLRSDKDQIPNYANDFKDLIRILLKQDIDAIFSDFPDMIPFPNFKVTFVAN
ncbi:glycerophosphodiester phosphodiesterase [Rickettsiales bacterium]|nr:glycerophosphodiester phosphodiesterase [Rickettsiales bacterium]